MANIHDVARVAGVSISTVSYALSGKRSISEKTRSRIDSAVQELGYLPNAAGRMLAGARTHILALTAPLRADTYAPAHMAFVLAVATAARRFDYDILLLTEDEATLGLQRVTSSRLVDGIIVLDVAIDDERIDVVRNLSTPTVLVGIPGDPTGLICVDLDFEAAARLCVDTFADAGHRAVGLLGHPPAVYERGSNFPHRFRSAFMEHAQERGLEATFEMPRTGPQGVEDAVDELLNPAAGVTAVAMHCEESLQIRALSRFAEAGRSIPDDLSVLSACSSFDTSSFSPPLDVIPLVAADSCDSAVALVMQALDGPLEPRIELVPPRFTPRGSVAPPRGANRPAPAP
ncbi:DNA-binding LacI/PurR family transcriptional regulator [Arthrobacter sp. UYP6]|uniref:LacI family DNA-binding transcriptional regulator n=1 Tax=Arthrobacter sp. UYP6 TaxID=1756378 RepID=UPI003394CCE4